MRIAAAICRLRAGHGVIHRGDRDRRLVAEVGLDADVGLDKVVEDVGVLAEAGLVADVGLVDDVGLATDRFAEGWGTNCLCLVLLVLLVLARARRVRGVVGLLWTGVLGADRRSKAAPRCCV